MAEFNSEAKRIAYKALVESINSKVADPDDRAKAILEKLQALDPKPVYWDQICYAIAILASATESMPSITGAVREISKHIYNTHYLLGDELGLWQLSPEEKELKSIILS